MCSYSLEGEVINPAEHGRQVWAHLSERQRERYARRYGVPAGISWAPRSSRSRTGRAHPLRRRPASTPDTTPPETTPARAPRPTRRTVITAAMVGVPVLAVAGMTGVLDAALALAAWLIVTTVLVVLGGATAYAALWKYLEVRAGRRTAGHHAQVEHADTARRLERHVQRRNQSAGPRLYDPREVLCLDFDDLPAQLQGAIIADPELVALDPCQPRTRKQRETTAAIANVGLRHRQLAAGRAHAQLPGPHLAARSYPARTHPARTHPAQSTTR